MGYATVKNFEGRPFVAPWEGHPFIRHMEGFVRGGMEQVR